MSYIEVTDQNFAEVVEKSDIPVVVDFWAPWCGPCRMLAPIFEKLSNDYEGKIKFVKVNVDENPATAIKYNIQGIPNILLFKDNQVFGKPIVGVKLEEEYEKELDNILGENNSNTTKEGKIININGTQEFTTVLENNKAKLILADFWAPWCGPCRMLTPTLEQVAKDYAGKIQLVKINVDNMENQQLAMQFQVKSIPTVAFIKYGENPEITVGALPYEQLKEYIEKKM